MISICLDSPLVKGYDIIANWEMVMNFTFFHGLIFLNVEDGIPVFSPDLFPSTYLSQYRKKFEEKLREI